MGALKAYLHELKEMIQACEQQDEHIYAALHETNPEDWMNVETTYTLEENVHTQKN